jgi:hypothetical protein
MYCRTSVIEKVQIGYELQPRGEGIGMKLTLQSLLLFISFRRQKKAGDPHKGSLRLASGRKAAQPT